MNRNVTLFSAQLSENAANQNICTVLGVKLPLATKTIMFFNPWLPTVVNVLKYGSLMLPVFVLLCSALSVTIPRRFSPVCLFFACMHACQKCKGALTTLSIRDDFRLVK